MQGAVEMFALDISQRQLDGKESGKVHDHGQVHTVE